MTTTEALIKIIAGITHANAAELFPTTLLKDIKADSLHWVQIIVNSETQFGVEIDMEKVKTFQTIGDFVTYVEGLPKSIS